MTKLDTQSWKWTSQTSGKIKIIRGIESGLLHVWQQIVLMQGALSHSRVYSGVWSSFSDCVVIGRSGSLTYKVSRTSIVRILPPPARSSYSLRISSIQQCGNSRRRPHRVSIRSSPHFLEDVFWEKEQQVSWGENLVKREKNCWKKTRIHVPSVCPVASIAPWHGSLQILFNKVICQDVNRKAMHELQTPLFLPEK